MRYAILAVLLIAAIGVVWYSVMPAWSEAETQIQTKEEHQTALDKVAEFKDLRRQYIKQYQALLEEDMTRLRRMLPANGDLLRLFMYIDAVSAEYDIEITNLGVNEEAGASELFAAHEVSFSFQADYPTLISFLEDLESRLRLLDTRSLEFSAPADEREYEYSLTLQTYSL